MASEKKFNCTICLRSFRDKEQLQNHIQFGHEDTRNHICGPCGRRFKTKSDLDTHKKKVHGNRKKRKIFSQETVINTETSSKKPRLVIRFERNPKYRNEYY